MKNSKLTFTSIIVLSLLVLSCKEEDKCQETICPNGYVCVDGTCMGTSTNEIISSNITTNTTWTNDKVYEINGRITVVNGVTLTIEAGTVIKGQVGTGVNASALVIARGARIIAEGNADLPIIFTSVADKITPEHVASGILTSPNLDANSTGLWGGLLILGKAPISASAAEIQIEGIPTTDPSGLYGGNNADDNSGVLKYISIRHGGVNIGNGNEINGLTLGGVGSGTVVENIEIIGNQDDGIEIFGGTVNIKNILVVNSGDDAIDTDQSWAGTLDNFIIICGPATDHALEIDGPEGTFLASQTLLNGSVKGSSVAEMGDFRACARGSFGNINFFGFPDPSIDGRGDFSLSNPSASNCTVDNFTNGILNFNNIEVVLAANVALNTVFKNGTDAHATAVSTSTVGADKSTFFGWTWTDKAALLFDFK